MRARATGLTFFAARQVTAAQAATHGRALTPHAATALTIAHRLVPKEQSLSGRSQIGAAAARVRTKARQARQVKSCGCRSQPRCPYRRSMSSQSSRALSNSKTLAGSS